MLQSVTEDKLLRAGKDRLSGGKSCVGLHYAALHQAAHELHLGSTLGQREVRSCPSFFPCWADICLVPSVQEDLHFLHSNGPRLKTDDQMGSFQRQIFVTGG